MCKKKFIFKKKVLITLFLGIFILSGCGQNENGKSEGSIPLTGAVDHPVDEEGNTELIETEKKAEDIYYRSEDGIDLSRAVHRCVSDGKNIYLVHGGPDLYVMPIGTDGHSPAYIDNPDEMDICNIALDTYGRIHLLMAGQDNEKWFIWRLDENCHVDKTIDISAYFETKHMPLWFLIDKDGTYYFKWAISRNGIVVDSEGVLKHRFTPESLGARWIYEAAVGKDGLIYIVYGNSDGELEIGRLDVQKCSIENQNPNLCFSGNETFNAMSGGTDTNLLLLSPYSGVWAYDYENGIMENRVPLSEIGFDPNTEFYPLTFLPDGRLILLGKTVSNNPIDGVGNENFKDWLLKYIPAGK